MINTYNKLVRDNIPEIIMVSLKQEYLIILNIKKS